MRFKEVLDDNSEQLRKSFASEWQKQGYYTGDIDTWCPECYPWRYVRKVKDFDAKDMPELVKMWYTKQLPAIFSKINEDIMWLEHAIINAWRPLDKAKQNLEKVNEMGKELSQVVEHAKKLRPDAINAKAIADMEHRLKALRKRLCKDF